MEWFIVIALTLVCVGLAVAWKKKRDRVAELESEFSEVVDVHDERVRIEGVIAQRQKELSSVEEKVSLTGKRVAELEGRISELEELEELQSYGFYTPKYRFESASRYGERVKEVRAQQKAMIKAKTAAVCHKNWTVEGSQRQGERMMNNQIKLMLRAFNGECDAAISKVTFKNLEVMERRLRSSRDALNKILAKEGFEITHDYLTLKLQELWLVHEHAEKKKEEADEQRRIKEQMREEAKAEKELEKATREAARQEQSFEKALAKARQELERAKEDVRSQMSEQIAELERQLDEAKERNQRAISQAQLTRSGHVYVISNTGSFGPGVYKIGLTRRLEPMDRVKELGDASVPFSFDVHAMIYSTDAPGLENTLHKLFDAYRVNKVNRRKEYFRVSLAQIEAAVHEHCGDDVEFVHVAEAEEYRRSLGMEQEAVHGTSAMSLH